MVPPGRVECDWLYNFSSGALRGASFSSGALRGASFLSGALRGASGGSPLAEDQLLQLPEEGLVASSDDRAPGGPRHSPGGLDHGDAGAQVPGVGVVFEQGVKPPAGNPGEVEGKAPAAADVPHPG